MNKSTKSALTATLFLIPSPVKAGEIHAAVASNFTGAAQVLAERFEEKTGHRVVLAFGSTGKHYAQIKNGAPFEVFLAADAGRPELLERDKIAVPGTRFTYAIGRLVLWSPHEGYVDPKGAVLENGKYTFLALANPKLAPYGEAAKEVLQGRGLWEKLAGRLVQGENISQALQFVNAGNAELGFVALSQIIQPGSPLKGSYWMIPQSLYRPIEQQAVLLKDTEAARAFILFIKCDAARSLIRSHGYETPDEISKEVKHE